jgi:lysophospholipase L1-like esterase
MRLVALGDSITQSCWPPYLTLPLDDFHNAGIAGNTTAQMLARLSSDVLAYSPTDVTLLGGTNDVAQSLPLATSLANLAAIIDAIRATGATVWLLTIPPQTGKVAQVETYNAALPALAATHGARLIDIWPLLVGPAGDWATGYSPDGIHPGGTADALIAGAVQSALLAPPLLPADFITAWVTSPAGVRLADLERSNATPYRNLSFRWERRAAGSCSLQYAMGAAIDDSVFTRGNLIWMAYRGQTRVFVSRGRQRELTRDEHGSDWATVQGRGVRSILGRRLVYPTAFDPSTADGRNPTKWGVDAQWYRVINRAAGSMVMDMVTASASRFAAEIPIVAGTIETTGADGWTQDFCFEKISDVMASVEATYGDFDLVGDPITGNLVLNYYTAWGTDRSSSVLFEESADLLTCSVDETGGADTEPANYIIGRGQGEGVTTPPLTVSTQSAPFRNEAYLDARDMKTEAGVQIATDGALAEQAWDEAVAFEVDESRWTAWTDYGPCDLVRVIAPSRSVDVTGIVVAMTVAEGEQRTRTLLDLNAPRAEDLLKLKGQANASARSLGVTNRQPQGQLVPFSIADSVYFDTATASITGIYIPTRMYQTIECRLAIDFDQYPMPVSAAASGGGGTSGNGTSHNHRWAGYRSGTPGGYSLAKYLSGNSDAYVDLAPAALVDLNTGIDLTPHTHSTPNHTHTLTAAASKEAYPASHSVNLTVYKLVTGAWVQQGATITGITADAPDIDLSAYVTGAGRWRIVLQSAAAQPNGGRLGAHLSGYVLGAIQSS